MIDHPHLFHEGSHRNWRLEREERDNDILRYIALAVGIFLGAFFTHWFTHFSLTTPV